MTFARGSRAQVLPALLLVATMVFLVAAAPTATAAPKTPPPDDEGGSPSLTLALENASRGYTTAKLNLEKSQKEQAKLAVQLKESEAKVSELSKRVNELGAAAYRGGRSSLFTAALDSSSFENYLGKAQMLDQLAYHDGRELAELRATKKLLEEQRAKIDLEARNQLAQRDQMAKRKLDAERALGLVGGGSADSGVTGVIRVARAAPRGPDGGWPRERCGVDDPTTSGCLTPRMLHAYLEAREAKFQRHTSCSRPASFGEHGKGRACDFAAAASGFGGIAAGNDRVYGNNLAAFFVKNADRLGVLYVIWFRRIWMPGIGWSSYSGRGSPAAEHTNHVHLSVQ